MNRFAYFQKNVQQSSSSTIRSESEGAVQVYALHVPYGAPCEESCEWSAWKTANVWSFFLSVLVLVILCIKVQIRWMDGRVNYLMSEYYESIPRLGYRWMSLLLYDVSWSVLLVS